jgi:hypothetical protein
MAFEQSHRNKGFDALSQEMVDDVQMRRRGGLDGMENGRNRMMLVVR